MCLLKIALNVSFHDVLDELGHIDEWDELLPDKSYVIKHMKKIDPNWLDVILTKTARMCIKELEKSAMLDKEIIIEHESGNFQAIEDKNSPTAPLGTDSSGTETDRYEYAERQKPQQQGIVPTRTKAYLKYHVTAITGHQSYLWRTPLLIVQVTRPCFQR